MFIQIFCKKVKNHWILELCHIQLILYIYLIYVWRLTILPEKPDQILIQQIFKEITILGKINTD